MVSPWSLALPGGHILYRSHNTCDIGGIWSHALGEAVCLHVAAGGAPHGIVLDRSPLVTMKRSHYSMLLIRTLGAGAGYYELVLHVGCFLRRQNCLSRDGVKPRLLPHRVAESLRHVMRLSHVLIRGVLSVCLVCVLQCGVPPAPPRPQQQASRGTSLARETATACLVKDR